MIPVDLVLFAEHSLKLPENYLSPARPVEKKWPVFAALIIDFGMVFLGTLLMTAILNHGVGLFLVTNGPKAVFTPDMVVNLSSTFLPVILFSYFFFSFFLNNGQTWGMQTMKKRIQMKEQSFQDAFKWAIWSGLLCYSCGLTHFFRKKAVEQIKAHDWLYHDLLAFRESSEINLMDLVQDVDEELPPAWKEAA